VITLALGGPTSYASAHSPGTPVASSAQSPTYNIPPTSTGALGISKNSWGKASDVANGVAAVAAGVAVYTGAIAAGAAIPTLGLSVATAGTVATAAGLVSAGAWLVGSVFSYLSRDPIDRRFRSIFKPVFARVPAIHVPSARFARVGSSLHQLLQSDLRLGELATAFITSVNRASGARAAHNAKSVRRQRLAAAKYARLAAKLLFGFEGQRDAIERAFLAAHVDLTVPSQQVATGKSRIVAHGLPVSLTNALKTLTKGSVAKPLKHLILDFAALKAFIHKAAPRSLKFPASLPDPTAARAEARVAGALVGYANSVTK
jgi:hypothetical protein